jgi:hypothetical protein
MNSKIELHLRSIEKSATLRIFDFSKLKYVNEGK